MFTLEWIAALCCAALGDAPAAPSAAELAQATSFRAGQRLVATHYFYWYRAPSEHLDQLTLHFPEPSAVAYDSPAWHARQLADMRAAGIDVCLPVYWGAVGHEEKPDVAFSVRGLPALIAAADELAAAHVEPPKFGLFYDTSTLLAEVRGDSLRGERADLRTESGRELFYRTIRDYFCRVPPRWWACIDRRPIVVLYSAGFAAGWDQRAFDELGQRFAREFGGVTPFVVRDASWRGVVTDATCAWGAALDGPHFGERTVEIGAGYDDSAVTGRTTPIRQREDGRFYEKSWRAALNSKAELALVETWNEMHEGTSIAETAEFGRKYIELTAHYSLLFHRGETVADDLVLEHPRPVPRPDPTWRELGRGAERIHWLAADNGGALRSRPWEDGACTLESDGEPRLISCGASAELATYLYFAVSDAFAFDVDADFELELEWLDAGHGEFRVQFDSRDERASLEGAYTDAAPIVRTASGTWKTSSIALPRARFANRENGGSDLRIAIHGDALAVRALRLARVKR